MKEGMDREWSRREVTAELIIEQDTIRLGTGIESH